MGIAGNAVYTELLDYLVMVDDVSMKCWQQNSKLGLKSGIAQARENPCAASEEGLVYRLGRKWISARLAKEHRRGPMGQCYRNAAHLVDRNAGLRYVEGFAVSADTMLPVLHAWAVNAADEVQDPTWKDSETTVYFGVEIPLMMLLALMVETRVYGFIPSDYMMNYFMRRNGRIPGIADIEAMREQIKERRPRR